LLCDHFHTLMICMYDWMYGKNKDKDDDDDDDDDCVLQSLVSNDECK